MKIRSRAALLFAALSLSLLALAAPAGAHLRILSPHRAIALGENGHVDLRSGRHVPRARAVEPGHAVTNHRAIYVPPAPGSEEPAGATAGAASPEAAPTVAAAGGTTAPILEAGFEHGFANWNTAGLGEAMPTIESSDTRSGSHAARVELTGSQNRSELSLGGDGGDDNAGMVHFTEGSEYWYGFSFNIQQMVWGHPGAHNLIMQFKSEGEGSPEFGLQLWNYAGDGGHGGGKGLWSHSNPSSEAPGGDRFLAPVGEDEWHDVAIHFKASSQGEGFYEIFLDGQLVESRSNVTMIVPGTNFAYIKDGIYRNGDAIPGTSEVLFDAAALGTSAASVAPR